MLLTRARKYKFRLHQYPQQKEKVSIKMSSKVIPAQRFKQYNYNIDHIWTPTTLQKSLFQIFFGSVPIP